MLILPQLSSVEILNPFFKTYRKAREFCGVFNERNCKHHTVVTSYSYYPAHVNKSAKASHLTSEEL